MMLRDSHIAEQQKAASLARRRRSQVPAHKARLRKSESLNIGPRHAVSVPALHTPESVCDPLSGPWYSPANRARFPFR
jgi:hypothetical protein